MTYVNIHEAKTQLSKLIQAIESGAEQEITIARNGKPAAMIVPIPKHRPIRLGIADGKYLVPDDIDRDNAAIARMFHGEDGE